MSDYSWDDKYCYDGDRHDWENQGGPDGMVCLKCGVSEAELDHLLAQKRRAQSDPVR